MIIRQYRRRVTDPPGSRTVVVELVTEDVSSGTVNVTSDVRGLLESRPATADEAQWESDQMVEQGLQASEGQALVRLDAAADVLRGWAADAAGVVAAWDTASDLQKDQWTKTTISRLGVLADNLADVLIQIGVRREI